MLFVDVMCVYCCVGKELKKESGALNALAMQLPKDHGLKNELQKAKLSVDEMFDELET